MHLTCSNRTEALLARLNARLAARREAIARGEADPFAPVRLVVPNRNVERYAELGVARSLGIAVNLRFERLDALVRRSLDAPLLLGDALLARVLRALLDVGVAREAWAEELVGPELAPVVRYLELGLRSGRHLDGMVDAYYGPPELAARADKDPRQVELILRESREVVRQRRGAIIVEHREGYVHANAGIDASNIASQADNPRLLLLPEDSNASARRLRTALRERLGIDLHIIINDIAGRAWRNGTCGFALGSSGFEALVSRIGDRDLFGRPLEITQIAVADELAAVASFLMGQADEGAPVVLVRGAQLRPSDRGCETLIRPKSEDLFR